MTLAHFSDTHLGYHAYRSSSSGLNQREVDVLKTFQATLDAILARDPDLVVHTGDMFHMVRPGNITLVQTYRLLAEFQTKRGGKPFVIIGGNHDTPRMVDSGSILPLFGTIPGIRVVGAKLAICEFPELDLEILAIPNESLRQAQNAEYVPSTQRSNRVLLLHGMAMQVMPQRPEFDVEETRQSRWSYVALGDFHCFQSFGDNICYSGSTDYASTNIWEEIRVGKVWVWYDTRVGKLEPVPIRTRKVMDLEAIDGLDLEPAEIEARMLANGRLLDVEDMPIVRQRIFNVLPTVRNKISQATIRELQSKSLHYQWEAFAPMAQPHSGLGQGGGRTLEKSWTEHIEKASIPAAVVRKELTDTGIELLQETTEAETSETET